MRQRLQSYLHFSSTSTHDVSILLFAIAGFAGVVESQNLPNRWGEGFEMLRIARNLAHHGSFANPFSVLDTGYTAANPPMYPAFLALLMKMVSNERIVTHLAMIGSVIMNAACAAMLPYLSILFFGVIFPGIIAALLWIVAIHPILSWDTSYTVAGLLLFTLLTASAAKKQERWVRSGMLTGVLAGVIFLLNPSAILIFLPWLAFVCANQSSDLRRTAFKYAAMILVTFSLFPLGWAFRNYLQLGGFVIRTNLGMTLYSSDNDCAQSSLFKDELNGCYQLHHPNTNLAEATLLRELGEIEFDRKRIADTKLWIKQNPAKFARLTATRFREFWFPANDPGTYHHAPAISVITLLSVPGLFLLVRRRVPATIYIIAVLVVYPLIYYIVVTDIRYRYPVLWLSLLPAGYFVSELMGLSRTVHPKDETV